MSIFRRLGIRAATGCFLEGMVLQGGAALESDFDREPLIEGAKKEGKLVWCIFPSSRFAV